MAESKSFARPTFVLFGGDGTRVAHIDIEIFARWPTNRKPAGDRGYNYLYRNTELAKKQQGNIVY